jgi:hypothetical protein
MAFGRTFTLLLAVLLLAIAGAQQPEAAGTAPQQAGAGAGTPGAASPQQGAAATPPQQPQAAAGAKAAGKKSFWPRKYCRERVMVAAPKAACQGAQNFCTSFLAACKDSKFNPTADKPCYDQAVWLEDFSTKNPDCTATA